ncbi:lipoprotein [Spiroplasma alleghenense]|uniref:Uncharacterized protein n=1 Tax=Spiroplasma alleghenense TaxID=216931 RepID=A0A345Z3P8_9MOLU|nr:lipoprotein [Spiroplasma alleghenense]AXK51227.1 hypothetical protein SALLE_v1c05530 [Spiroplasma alleghenense]
MKKLLSILASLGVTASVGSAVVACEDTTKGIIKLDKLKSAEFEAKDSKTLTIESVNANINSISGLEGINPNEVTLSNFKTNNADKKFTVDIAAKAASKTVSGKVAALNISVVEYKKKSLIDLVKTLDLGEISIKDKLPTSEELVGAIKAKNYSSVLNNGLDVKEDYAFDKITENGAILKATQKSGYFIVDSQVSLTYKVRVEADVQKNLSDLIKVAAIGEVQIAGDKPTIEEISTALLAKNPDLVKYKDQVEFKFKGDENKLIVSVKKDAKNLVANGVVEVSFTTKKAPKKLDEIIIVKNLETIEVEKSIPTEQQILDSLVALNKGLEVFKNEIVVQKGITTKSAIVAAKDDATLLVPKTSVKLEFSVNSKLPKLSSLIKQTDLGKIEEIEGDNNGETVKVPLAKLNPEIANYINELVISPDYSEGKSIIKVKDSSEKLFIDDQIEVTYQIIENNVEPEAPVEPETPVNIAKPADSAKPVAPVNVSKPADSAKPVAPVNVSKPADSAKPVVSSNS